MFKFLLFTLLNFTFLLSISQEEYNLSIEIGDNQSINIYSVSMSDTLKLIVDTNSALYLDPNNQNYIYNKHIDVKTHLYITKNDILKIVINKKNKILFEGENSSFTYFLNEYYQNYHNFFTFESDIFKIKESDQFEISLYKFIDNELNKMYINFKTFSDFNEDSKSYFKKIIYYEYLNALTNFQLISNGIDFFSEKINNYDQINNIKTSVLDFENLTKNINDTSFYHLDAFKSYAVNSLILYTLNNYNYKIASLDDFNMYSKYFFSYLNDNLLSKKMIYLSVYHFVKFFSNFLNKSLSLDLELFLKSGGISKDKITFINELFKDVENETIVEEEKDSELLSFNFYMENLHGEVSRLDDYIGKVIYLDLWASWCGPCRQQFPHSKELKKKFTKRELKKLQFIYISIDTNNSKWKKAIEELEIEGEHFISPSNRDKSAGEFFQAASIPRYIIIDKKGKIIDQNAKRPSDDKIFYDLKDLIK